MTSSKHLIPKQQVYEQKIRISIFPFNFSKLHAYTYRNIDPSNQNQPTRLILIFRLQPHNPCSPKPADNDFIDRLANYLVCA